MPPPTPRPSLSSASTTTNLCLRCNSLPTHRLLATTTTRRHHPFSTTTTNHGPIPVPPESPKFIHVPEPPQSKKLDKTWIKGHLPIPREIFTKHSGGSKKVSPGYVERATPLSKREAAGLEPRDELDAWRRRAAQSRRAAFQEGVQGLWDRKIKREAAEAARSKTKSDRNRIAAQETPEGGDDVLTQASVSGQLLDTAVFKDPEYKTKQLASQERTTAIMAAKSSGRKDALQRLYIAAGDFIVKEDDLEAKIDELFADDYWSKRSSAFDTHQGQNMWQTNGMPPTVASMFRNQTGSSSFSAEYFRGEGEKTARRQQILAEELTGGKMP